MPTAMTHYVLGFIAAKTVRPARTMWRFLLLSMVCSALPDIDMLGLRAGIPYGHFLGHRGFFHSPFFALLLSVFVVAVFFWRSDIFRRKRGLLVVHFFLLTASHGLLDAMTDGGSGVAMLSPVSNARYFMPWQPLYVAPLGRGIFSARGLQVLGCELVWILIPACVVWLIFWVGRNIFIEEE